VTTSFSNNLYSEDADIDEAEDVAAGNANMITNQNYLNTIHM
jgi:hypothetical protein